MIPYLLHVSILLAGCYVFYWFMLRQETFFQLNRSVLIACLLLPMVLPLISIPASWSLQFFQNENSSITYNNTSTKSKNTLDTKDQTVAKEIKNREEVVLGNSKVPNLTENIAVKSIPNISAYQVFTYLYFSGMIVFALAFLVQLIIIVSKITSLNSLIDGKYRIVELVKDEAPFSFWNTIFINPTKYDNETYEQILAHEKIHIDQTHFFDKLLVEIILIIFWFNPFVWLFRKAITNNLEFLTDQSMLTQGFPKQSYQMSLLKVSVTQHPLNLTTNYNQSFLKNRIAMMNTKKSSARSIWKYLFILPLLGLSMLSLNAVDANSIEEKSNGLNSENSTIAIDNNTFTNEGESIAESKAGIKTKKELLSEPSGISGKVDEDKLKNELLSNLKRDNLLTNQDPVFKFYPEKILLNEKPLNEKLRKKYAKIFKKYGLEPNVSRLLILNPVVIMSGSFVGNENTSSDSHVDIFEEGEDLEGSISDRSKTSNVNINKNDINNVNINKNNIGNSEHKDGHVSVHTVNGKTYVQGQGTHNINGKTYTITDSEIHMIEGDVITHTIHPVEQLSHLEKEYLERSKGKGHLPWLGDASTALSSQKGNENWRLPEFCEALKKELEKDELIDRGDKIILYYGSNQIFINGWQLTVGGYEQYIDLAMKYGIDISEGWNIEIQGNNVIVVGRVSDIDQLRIDLVNMLLQDGLINDKKEKALIKIPGKRIIVNGKDIPANKIKSYYHVLQNYRITPSPGKIIEISQKRSKKSIQVGYARDNTFLGTFSME